MQQTNTGKTLADHARAYRTRKAERISRMEAALREIAALPERPIHAVSEKYAAGLATGWLDAAVIARLVLTRTNTKEA